MLKKEYQLKVMTSQKLDLWNHKFGCDIWNEQDEKCLHAEI